MIELPHDCRAASLRALAAGAAGDVLMAMPGWRVEMLPHAEQRMRRVMADTGAALVYGDYCQRQPDGSLRAVASEEWQPGALREGLDLGPVWMVAADAFTRAAAAVADGYAHAALYALRLALQRQGPVARLAEPLCLAQPPAPAAGQWAYVDPANRARQQELEAACTDHLRAVGALLVGEPERLPAEATSGGKWPVEASVVIPVRNRRATVADAVGSALAQAADFPYNVIVVDNHSDDGTTELLSGLAAADARVVHVVPAVAGLGIGGCWNHALHHPLCGRYAVQLDSDDLYQGVDVLTRVVDAFRAERCAMVVGSYTLTDIDGNTLAPGLIDHREWTPANGRNNLLRVNGIGAPRAFATAVARQVPLPNSSYGEDYAMALALSRRWHVGRIFDSLYLCRRWGGNSDAALSPERMREHNHYKDTLRTQELAARQLLNATR